MGSKKNWQATIWTQRKLSLELSEYVFVLIFTEVHYFWLIELQNAGAPIFH